MVTVDTLLEAKGRFVATVPPNATVLDAAKEMNARRVGALVVIEGKKVAGIISERDILTRVVVAQMDPSVTKVEQVMSKPVACCRPETEVGECKSIMTMKRIRHLPVMDKGNLSGILTIGDLLAREVVDHAEKIEYLQQYIDGNWA